MGHSLFDLLKLLDNQGVHYRLDRFRPDTIIVQVAMVGERLEIDVFEDGDIEFSRFRGDESVESDPTALADIIKQHC